MFFRSIYSTYRLFIKSTPHQHVRRYSDLSDTKPAIKEEREITTTLDTI